MNYKDEFISTFEQVDNHAENIKILLLKDEYPPNCDFLFKIEYILRELFNNAVEHGNKFDENKKVFYEINYYNLDFNILIWDEGEGLNLPLQECEDITSCRNRGLSSIIKLGVNLKFNKKTIHANISICQKEMKNMDIELKGSVLNCKIEFNLTSTNVRYLVLKMKEELEKYDNYEELDIDISEVKSIDSIGITFLIGVYKTLSGKDKKFKLIGVSDSILQLLKIMKLDEIFEIEKAY